MEQSEFTERTLSTERTHTGKIVNVRLDRVALSNGSTSFREVVEHPGGAVVLPVDGEGRAWMVRQYRYPIARELLEAPAGKLEPGEAPEAGARRELREETGLTAGRLEKLGVFYPSPGFCDECLHLFLARELTQGEACPDEDELLRVVPVRLETLINEALAGKLTDGKTLAALFLARERMAREQA